MSSIYFFFFLLKFHQFVFLNFPFIFLSLPEPPSLFLPPRLLLNLSHLVLQLCLLELPPLQLAYPRSIIHLPSSISDQSSVCKVLVSDKLGVFLGHELEKLVVLLQEGQYVVEMRGFVAC